MFRIRIYLKCILCQSKPSVKILFIILEMLSYSQNYHDYICIFYIVNIILSLLRYEYLYMYMYHISHIHHRFCTLIFV